MPLSISSAPRRSRAQASPRMRYSPRYQREKRPKPGHLPNPLLPKTLFKPQDCLHKEAVAK
jgi:hypothetical protein